MEANAISLISQWVTLLCRSPAFPLRKTKLGGVGEPPSWGAQRRDSSRVTDERWGWRGRGRQVCLSTFSRKPRKMALRRRMETLRSPDTSSPTPRLSCPSVPLPPPERHQREPTRRSWGQQQETLPRPTHVAPWVSAQGFGENVGKDLRDDLASILCMADGEGEAGGLGLLLELGRSTEITCPSCCGAQSLDVPC